MLFWQRCEMRHSIIGTSLHAAFMSASDTGAYPYARKRVAENAGYW
ncbi:hypothetical protein [Paenibacillus silvae]|nr:hypothetical protein [Paenibacillus silvae]MCK6270119.1 hypothetical protein [Paenibacillus silvae]